VANGLAINLDKCVYATASLEVQPLRHRHVGGPPARGPAGPLLNTVRGGQPVSSSGTSDLVLPGQFLTDLENIFDDFIQQFEIKLRSAESRITRHNTAARTLPPLELPSDLTAARMVLVFRDGHVPTTSPLYEGPSHLLSRSLYRFTIQMGEREGWSPPAGSRPAATKRCCL
jgi:hypothetical protein